MNHTYSRLVKSEPKPNPQLGTVAQHSAIKLRFAPTAFAKLLYFRDNGNHVEISGMGISNKENPLLIEDFALIKQESNSAHTEFDEEAFSNFIEDMFDKGIQPRRCGRIWIHTHPGFSPRPSGEDESTFRTAFGRQDWSIMCILSTSENIYARLRLNIPFECTIELPVVVDWGVPVEPIDYQELDTLYKELVSPWSFQSYSYNSGYGKMWDGEAAPLSGTSSFPWINRGRCNASGQGHRGQRPHQSNLSKEDETPTPRNRRRRQHFPRQQWDTKNLQDSSFQDTVLSGDVAVDLFDGVDCSLLGQDIEEEAGAATEKAYASQIICSRCEARVALTYDEENKPLCVECFVQQDLQEEATATREVSAKVTYTKEPTFGA